MPPKDNSNSSAPNIRKKRWETMRSAASKILHKPENNMHKSYHAKSHRGQSFASEILYVEPDDEGSEEQSSPFPGITYHKPTSSDEVLYPGGGGLSVGASMPTKKVQPMVQKSLRQQRESLQLPGSSRSRSRKKFKNLANCVSKKVALVTDLDKVKLAPLVSSKHPMKLEFTSADCKLSQTNFLKDFQDNIKVLDLGNNALTEFPPVNHLKSLRRLFLNGNRIESFSLEGLDSLELFSIENNKIQELPYSKVKHL